MFLDCICGSTTGELGLLGLYINEHNVALINQTLETLTEYSQGPCHENQNCIATHESNGLDIITALLLTDINPLGQRRMDLVLDCCWPSPVMESRGESENAERILYNMNPRQLVDVACKAYHQKLVGGEEAASPKEVGLNIYILCHHLAQHNKELAALMKPPPVDGVSGDAALQYYANHPAQIEIVRHDRTMEQIVFPIPEMCEYLTNDTKVRVFHTAERDDQGSKVTASSHLAPDSHFHLFNDLFRLIWAVMLLSAAVAITLPKPSGIRTLIMTVILRLICSAGPQPTLMLLGTATVVLKGVHLLSIMGNAGTFQRSVRQIFRMSARCDWSTGDYLRKGRHRPGLRLTSLGGLTKRPPKSSNKGDRSRARDSRARGNGTGKGICITG
ncbi:hypothetical protein DAPPUDRAFT_275084 [Daphnia pulex]|uniref:RyR/IP3R Homology associated domain-containing protein n=1 Tax=Daphnia pulex TaxID=6669 RepID=E9I542_DAPPU|nr:hypothetical protein DAPPUDRAFT_275084 [Daphnia pulex]|eukprot:EFX60888.1 hypothetical protein DAPPUDRAFT_275084 [Daphnia pulex]